MLHIFRLCKLWLSCNHICSKLCSTEILLFNRDYDVYKGNWAASNRDLIILTTTIFQSEVCLLPCGGNSWNWGRLQVFFPWEGKCLLLTKESGCLLVQWLLANKHTYVRNTAERRCCVTAPTTSKHGMYCNCTWARASMLLQVRNPMLVLCFFAFCTLTLIKYQLAATVSLCKTW